MYSSALIFSPETSIVRRENLGKAPAWLRKIPRVEDSQESLIQPPAGHSSQVEALALSPDGRQITSGSSDGTIKLWDAVTGDLQKTMTGHSDWVNTVASSPDGKQLVSGSSDCTFKLWDVAKCLKPSHYLGGTINSRSKFRSWQKIKTSGPSYTLKSSANTRCLVTGINPIETISAPANTQSTGSESSEALWVTNEWVYCGATPVLRLPSDFQSTCYDVRGSQVAIGFKNGRVLAFDIDNKGLRQ